MSRLAALIRSRPRPSTLVLLAVFGGLLALYVIVRPDTSSTGDTRPQTTVAPSPTPTG